METPRSPAPPRPRDHGHSPVRAGAIVDPKRAPANIVVRLQLGEGGELGEHRGAVVDGQLLADVDEGGHRRPRRDQRGEQALPFPEGRSPSGRDAARGRLPPPGRCPARRQRAPAACSCASLGDGVSRAAVPLSAVDQVPVQPLVERHDPLAREAGGLSPGGDAGSATEPWTRQQLDDRVGDGCVSANRKRWPAVPSPTTSARPPTRVATTGMPHAIASAAATQKLSATLVISSRSVSRRIGATSAVHQASAQRPPRRPRRASLSELAASARLRSARARRRCARGRRERPGPGCGILHAPEVRNVNDARSVAMGGQSA